MFYSEKDANPKEMNVLVLMVGKYFLTQMIINARANPHHYKNINKLEYHML